MKTATKIVSKGKPPIIVRNKELQVCQQCLVCWARYENKQTGKFHCGRCAGKE